MFPATSGVQVAGFLGSLQILGQESRKAVSTIKDATGVLQLIWFQGISWMEKNLNRIQI
jgi:ATP-dependent DNA helicase RecG